MKSRILITSLPLIAAVFMTGCLSQDIEDADIAQRTFNNETYTEAQESLNKNLCTYIENSELKETCIESIEAKFTIIKAETEEDSNICNDITAENYKEVCKEKLNAIEQETEKSKEEKEKTDKLIKAKENAVAKGDLSACDKLETPYNMTCRLDVITNNAISQNNPQLCDTLKDEGAIASCKDGVKLSNQDKES